MKTSFILFIFALASFSIQANNNPSSDLSKAKTLTVETQTWKASSIIVKIRQVDGTIILEETVKTGNLRKYNLKNLPAGDYILELSDKFRITEQSFMIKQEAVQLAANVSTTYKPVIAHKNNSVDVNLMTQGKNAYVSIFDTKGETLFEEKCESTSVHRRYDISRLPSGEYTVIVQVGDRTFTEKVQKN